MGSWLFIPGTNNKALKKIDHLDVHKVIIDLEDAVPLAEKSCARINAQLALSETKRKCLVRINDIQSGLWEVDVKTVFHGNLEGIVLPKAESAEDIVKLAELMNHLEEKLKLEKDSIKIYPLIESAKGVVNSQNIAASNKRVAQLVFGAVDYSLDLNLTLTKHGNELLHARSHLVITSKVANLLPPVDTVFIDIEDTKGLKEETIRVKELGFQGKLVIHPKQVEVVNSVFLITSDEIHRAEEIIEIFRQNDFKTVKHNGFMIDKPVYIKALKVVESKKI